MGYSHYILADGREAGYSVEATCDQDMCNADIDRGLAYLCGATPGGDEYGCGMYFCQESHLFDGPVSGAHQCGACRERWKAEHPHSFPEIAAWAEPEADSPLQYTIRCRCGSWEVTGPSVRYVELMEQHAGHEADADSHA